MPGELVRVFSQAGERSIVRIPMMQDCLPLVDKALGLLPASSVLVVENIRRDKEAEAFWSSLVNDPRTGVSFDLYYCGVIFLNREMVKQSYIVNF